MYKNVCDVLEQLGTDNEPTGEELEELGFVRWRKEHNLYLIPHRLFELLPDGVIITSVYGYDAVKGVHEISKEMFTHSKQVGCIKWGVIVSQEKQTL